MAQIPLIPTSPAIEDDIADYVAGTAAAFLTDLNANQDALEERDRLVQAALEDLTAAIGYGWLSGGAITAGVGLSVNVAAFAAIVGNWVGFNASQIVGGLTNAALNYLYLRQDGTWTANTTGVAPASTDGHGAALLWGTATCAAGVVSAVSNVRRHWLQNLSVVPLVTADPADAVAGDMWGRTDTTTIHIAGLGTFSVGGGGGAGLNFTGAYNNATTYAVDDVVSSGGSSYVCILSSLGHAPPNATYWAVLAAQGPAGAAGAAGPAGPPGAQGLTWRGAWSSVTAYAAYDLVSYSGAVYIAIGAGTNQNPATAGAYWAVFVPAGPAGAAGAAGAAGVNGSTWDHGSGAPAGGSGANGDYYLDTATGDVYKKVGGAWGIVANLMGAMGSMGLQGPAISRGCVITLCESFTPAATGADTAEVIVPFSPDDGTTVIVYHVRRIDLRVNAAGGAPSVDVEKSTVAGAFASAAVGTVTLGAGAYEGHTTAGLGTVQSGDKLRFDATALGTATGWTLTILLGE